MAWTENGSFAFSYIKPHIVRAGGVDMIKRIIQDSGFDIVCSQPYQLGANQILKLYPHLELIYDDSANAQKTVAVNISGKSELLILWSSDSDTSIQFRQLIGRSVGDEDQKADGLRKRFGVDIFRNVIHGSDSEQKAICEIEICDFRLLREVLLKRRYADQFAKVLTQLEKSK